MNPLDRPLFQVLLVALLCLIWGSTWFAIKIGLEDMPPLFGAGLRFFGAAAILFVLVGLQGVKARWTRQLHLGLLGLGVGVHSLSYGVVYWGEQYLPAGLTAVLFAIYPLLVALLASRVLADESLTGRKVAGVVASFVGIAIIFGDDVSLSHARAPLAAALVLLSPLAAAFSTIGIKRFGTAQHPYTLTMLPMLYGGATLLAVSLLTEDWRDVEWSASAIGALVYLTLFGSVVAFVVYYSLLKRVAASRLALISYLFPIVALLIDVVIVHERLGQRALLGSALVLGGVAIAGLKRRGEIAPTGASRA